MLIAYPCCRIYLCQHAHTRIYLTPNHPSPPSLALPPPTFRHNPIIDNLLLFLQFCFSNNHCFIIPPRHHHNTKIHKRRQCTSSRIKTAVAPVTAAAAATLYQQLLLLKPNNKIKIQFFQIKILNSHLSILLLFSISAQNVKLKFTATNVIQMARKSARSYLSIEDILDKNVRAEQIGNSNVLISVKTHHRTTVQNTPPLPKDVPSEENALNLLQKQSTAADVSCFFAPVKFDTQTKLDSPPSTFGARKGFFPWNSLDSSGNNSQAISKSYCLKITTDSKNSLFQI